MSQKPRIGVTGANRGGRMMWLLNRLALFRAGARAVRLTPAHSHPLEELDGFVIGGGDDINPLLYGGELELAVRLDPKRDRMEQSVLEHALAQDKPVLGICRGAQLANVFLGGSLHGDIHEVFKDAPRMRTVLPRKTVNIESDTRLRRILRVDRCRVNALHHQSVDRLGEGMHTTARDTSDIIQGIECQGRAFLMGVQWHPEFLVFDRGQQRLYRELVAASRRRMEVPPPQE